MFGVGIERPPWDSDNKYVPHRMNVYFEDRLNVSSDPKLVKESITVKLGYNELGFNEHSVTTNKF